MKLRLSCHLSIHNCTLLSIFCKLDRSSGVCMCLNSFASSATLAAELVHVDCRAVGCRQWSPAELWQMYGLQRSSSSTHIDVVQQSCRHFLSESSTWQPLGVTLTVTNTLSVAEHVQAIIRACEVWTVHPCGASNSHGLKYAALQRAYRVNGQLLSPDWLTQPALFISDEHLISDQISSLSNKTWLDYWNCLFGQFFVNTHRLATMRSLKTTDGHNTVAWAVWAWSLVQLVRSVKTTVYNRGTCKRVLG